MAPIDLTTEAMIKRQICEYLECRSTFFWIETSAGNRGRKNNSRFQRLGVADIIGIYRGKFLAVEVKKPGGKLSLEQVKFITDVNAAGGLAFVAYSLDDVIKMLA